MIGHRLLQILHGPIAPIRDDHINRDEPHRHAHRHGRARCSCFSGWSGAEAAEDLAAKRQIAAAQSAAIKRRRSRWHMILISRRQTARPGPNLFHLPPGQIIAQSIKIMSPNLVTLCSRSPRRSATQPNPHAAEPDISGLLSRLPGRLSHSSHFSMHSTPGPIGFGLAQTWEGVEYGHYLNRGHKRSGRLMENV